MTLAARRKKGGERRDEDDKYEVDLLGIRGRKRR